MATILKKEEISNKIEELFTKSDVSYEIETSRGLDHGAWIVLRKLYPEADIPVISMSVNPNLTPEGQYKIGKSLSVLRDNDILVIGSGRTVHNLRAVYFGKDNGQSDDWAFDFDEWVA